jgi:hypothetical protein
MNTQLSETQPSEIFEDTRSQLEDDAWVDDEDNIPVDSFYHRSDSEDSIGDTFFPGYGDLDVPKVEPEAYSEIPPLSPGEFCAVEELKKLLPGAFTDEQELHWWKKGWYGKVGIQTLCFVALLFIPIIFYLGTRLQIPLQFSVQLVLIRVAMQFQDRLWRFQGRRLRWHTLVSHLILGI